MSSHYDIIAKAIFLTQLNEVLESIHTQPSQQAQTGATFQLVAKYIGFEGDVIEDATNCELSEEFNMALTNYLQAPQPRYLTTAENLGLLKSGLSAGKSLMLVAILFEVRARVDGELVSEPNFNAQQRALAAGQCLKSDWLKEDLMPSSEQAVGTATKAFGGWESIIGQALPEAQEEAKQSRNALVPKPKPKPQTQVVKEDEAQAKKPPVAQKPASTSNYNLGFFGAIVASAVVVTAAIAFSRR